MPRLDDDVPRLPCPTPPCLRLGSPTLRCRPRPDAPRLNSPLLARPSQMRPAQAGVVTRCSSAPVRTAPSLACLAKSCPARPQHVVPLPVTPCRASPALTRLSVPRRAASLRVSQCQHLACLAKWRVVTRIRSLPSLHHRARSGNARPFLYTTRIPSPAWCGLVVVFRAMRRQ